MIPCALSRQRRCLTVLCCTTLLITVLLIASTGLQLPSASQLLISLFLSKSQPSVQQLSSTSHSAIRQNVLTACYKEKLLELAGIDAAHLPAYVTFKSPLNVSRAFSADCSASLINGSGKLPDSSFKESDKCFPESFEHKNRRDIYSALKFVYKTFESHKIKLILTDGSLIGSLRHFGLIPWDDDIDFFINEQDKPQVRNLLQKIAKFPNSSFEFFDTDIGMAHLKLGYKCWDKLRPDKTKSCVVQFDFFYIRRSDALIGRPFEGQKWFLKSEILPPILRPFGPDLLLPVPRQPLKFLSRQYDNAALTNCQFYTHTGAHLQCQRRSVNCNELRSRFAFVLRLSIANNHTSIIVEALMFRDLLLAVFVAE